MGVRFPPSGFTDRTAALAGVRYASWLRRAGGLVVDGLLIGMINYLIAGVLAFAVGPITNQFVSILFLVGRLSIVSIVYATLCLAKLHGQTPGMRVLQIRCVPVSQRGVVSMPQALTRAIIAAVVLSIPWLFSYKLWAVLLVPLAAYLWPLIDQRRQTIWDYVAATVVLDDRGF